MGLWNSCFNRINPNRLIPTYLTAKDLLALQSFQSYQSKQINPDCSKGETAKSILMRFQSYQSKQINPDNFLRNLNTIVLDLVSIVSIQTD